MGLTALLEHGTDLGAAAVVEYRGATTAARFGDPQVEFAAFRNGCGVYDLGYRAKVSITGRDRVRWLNGMVTNNIRDLAAGQGVYAFMLTPQGHILGDLYVYNRGESFVVDSDRSQMEKILATFDHYIIMDDVELIDASDSMTALGIAGLKAREVLRAAGIGFPEARPLQVFDATCTCDCDCMQCTVVRGDDPACESYELWVAPKEVRKTWDALVAHGATRIGAEAMEIHRIVNGIPLYGVDIHDRDLPQETEQMRALNFSKGCYIGQEIVERIRSRGTVHRKLTGFVAGAGQPIAAGTKIIAADKEVGEVTSVAALGSPNPEGIVALGYVRREVAVPGHDVIIGGARATVVSLPIPDSALGPQAVPVARPA